MSVAEYGAFGYSSEENYCHTVRWVISGTLLPQYASDTHPVAIKRGTRARILSVVQTDCAANGGNGFQDTKLTHVEVTEGKYAGQDRYILGTDWYSQKDYDEFAKEQKHARKIAAVERARLAAAKAKALRKGDKCYQPGILAHAALDAANASAWQNAYSTAVDGLSKNELCGDANRKLENDGILMTAKGWSERHLGMGSTAWADMRAADDDLQRCDKLSNSDFNCDAILGQNTYMLKGWAAADSGQ
jgi:heme-degrading monooxygenase HmoA